MADEQDKQQPSLELPKVFGRSRKNKGQQPVPAAAPAPEPPAPDAEPAARPDGVVSEPETIAMPPEPATREAPATAEPVAPVAEEPVRPPVPAAAPESQEAPEAPTLFADEARTDVLTAAPPEAPPAAPKKPRTRPSLSMPDIGGYPAAGLTGLLVGLLLVGLTAGALRACEALRGTATCGGAIGITTLVGIMALLVVLGGLILRAFDVPDPISSSFLALGMVSVVALLFLLDVLMTPWGIVLIPLLTVLSYLAARWVTTAFVEGD